MSVGMVTGVALAVTLLQVADGVSTVVALRLPGLVEGNAIARRVFHRLGIVTGVIIFKAVAIAVTWGLALAEVSNDGKVTVLGIVAVVYAWAIADNIRLIRIARRARSDAASRTEDRPA